MDLLSSMAVTDTYANNIYIYAIFPMHFLNFQIKVWFLTGLLFQDWLKGQKLICTSAQCVTVRRKARGNFKVLGFHLDSLWHLLCNLNFDQPGQMVTFEAHQSYVIKP